MEKGADSDRTATAGGVRVHVWVSGTVQGVFFRQTCRTEAAARGLRGWVRNLPDSRVEAVFEGSERAVDEMVRWCYGGPPRASVSEVRERRKPPTGERGFEVR